MAFYQVNDNKGGSGVGITTSAINTQTSGSTILAFVARGRGSDFTGNSSWNTSPATNVPTDNKGNGTVAQVGTTQDYTAYTSSGDALFAWQNAIGGTGQTFHEAMVGGNDEITFSIVEVTNGGLIESSSQTQVGSSIPNTSLSVTTTGPATLVAFWTGDYGGASTTSNPGNGFTLIDSETISNDAVETDVAYKDVSTAGTYSVAWTESPTQAANLLLVAVQTVPEPMSVGPVAAVGSAALLRRRRRFAAVKQIISLDV